MYVDIEGYMVALWIEAVAKCAKIDFQPMLDIVVKETTPCSMILTVLLICMAEGQAHPLTRSKSRRPYLRWRHFGRLSPLHTNPASPTHLYSRTACLSTTSRGVLKG